MNKLLGVVMCGGQSKRMGRDKGLISIDDTHWAKHIATKLEAISLPVVASVNPAQVDDYCKLFSSEQLIVDNVAVGGPLRGLLSVHQQYPSHNLLLVACDMIDMEIATLKKIMAVYHADASYDFYVYQNGEFAEPFGAIYTASGLKTVMEKVESDTLTRFSLKGVLDNGHTKRIPLDDYTSFKNYNSQ